MFPTPSRRALLQTVGNGFGLVALAALAHEEAARAAAAGDPLASRRTHFPARATRVVFLCMEGAPSHVDTFDHKPQLARDDGRAAPAGKVRAGAGPLAASPFRFDRHGESGLAISELFPETARHADRLCLLNGMHTDLPNHAQAFLQLHCGISQFPRPSLGAWVLYGLGSENADLPGFVTIAPPRTNGGAANYAASFLPSACQGTRIGRGPDGTAAVTNLRHPTRTAAAQRLQLDYVQDLNRDAAATLGGSPEIEGLIASYELAFRMQAAMPDVLDLSRETAATLARYGIDAAESPDESAGMTAGPGGGDGPGAFGRSCLLARRLLEAGVRFVEVTMGGWDHHRDLRAALATSCGRIDRPIAALLADLDERGLLTDTLVLWGGEFGRSPCSQGDGRDHNNKGFTTWMAGGGVKGGFVHGATDEHGFEAVAGRVHIHDWHATILHLLGLDHERLTFRHAGRDMRLTDVAGTVVREILA